MIRRRLEATLKRVEGLRTLKVRPNGGQRERSRMAFCEMSPNTSKKKLGREKKKPTSDVNYSHVGDGNFDPDRAGPSSSGDPGVVRTPFSPVAKRSTSLRMPRKSAVLRDCRNGSSSGGDSRSQEGERLPADQERLRPAIASTRVKQIL